MHGSKVWPTNVFPTACPPFKIEKSKELSFLEEEKKNTLSMSNLFNIRLDNCVIDVLFFSVFS